MECTSRDGSTTHTLDVDPSTTLLNLRYQLFSLTDIPPDRILLHFNSSTPRLPNDDLDATQTLSDLSYTATHLIYDQLIPDSAHPNQSSPADTATVTATSSVPVQIGVHDVQAASHSAKALSLTDHDRDRVQEFLRRVRAYHEVMLTSERSPLQAKALALVPLEQLVLHARERVGTEGRYRTYERALAKELLRWFKGSFFSWVNVPRCRACDGGEMKMLGMVAPLESELRYGGRRVEEYECGGCAALTRFPRYNDAGKLLETRMGRCGEWAKAFTLVVRAVGLRARTVYDWTDHVWTEIYCEEGEGGQGGMWVHADSCEDLLDEPLVYEKGWGKKLTYCVAVGKDCVMDVTRRYTADFDKVLERRTLVDEGCLKAGLRELNDEALGRLPEKEKLEARRRYERDETQLVAVEKQHGELQGRQSGSVEWVKTRGEDGSHG